MPLVVCKPHGKIRLLFRTIAETLCGFCHQALTMFSKKRPLFVLRPGMIKQFHKVTKVSFRILVFPQGQLIAMFPKHVKAGTHILHSTRA